MATRSAVVTGSGMVKLRPASASRCLASVALLVAHCSPHYPHRRVIAEGAESGASGDAGAPSSGGTESAGGGTSGGAMHGGAANRSGGRSSSTGGSEPEPSAGASGADVCSSATCAEGGESSGGAGQGGAEPAGGASGGAQPMGGVGGASGAPTRSQPFIVGADISSVPEMLDDGAVFSDTDGTEKPITELLKAHGFNYVRLRTFVDPWNLYGYANPNGEEAYYKAEPYCDAEHTAEFGKLVKDAGMGLLVDLHYSDNWADPGKQVIPERWRGVSSIEELGENVKTYTSEIVHHLIDAGASPDMIQIGNEITPGMLIQVPAADPNADQWGNMNKVTNKVNGSASNWANLALLLKRGIEGVRAVDPEIQIMLHIENTSRVSGVVSWVNNALSHGVEFDILGLSCYTTWQGQPEVWEATFRTVADTFPELSFVIAEYGLERRRANDIMFNLPEQRGLGTFLWEPTQSGVWGGSMFSYSGSSYQADAEAFAEFDAIRDDYGLE